MDVLYKNKITSIYSSVKKTWAVPRDYMFYWENGKWVQLFIKTCKHNGNTIWDKTEFLQF